MKDNSLLWRKAAVIGSLWAASEIILGSFLHNARIPFSGRLLTGIGIAILVAGHRLWPEKGLLWRTGLVCAAMKSVSPSAVLLSPMIAIFTEGLLAEGAVLLAGANIAGYLLAGGLIMSWGLVHKVGKMLIIYGPGSVAIYARGLEKLREILGAPGGVWGPVLALVGLYFIAGTAAALLGLKASGKGELLDGRPAGEEAPAWHNAAGSHGYHSVYFLPFHLVLISGLMASGRLPLWAAAGLSGAYGLVCALFYGRARSLLARADIWAGVVLVSILGGLLLGDWGAGLRMAARAFALTLGFAGVAQELLNPSVKAAMEKLAGRTFFETLEHAFATLPLVLACLPSGRNILLNPAASLRTIISRAPELLDEPSAGARLDGGSPDC